MWASPCVQTLQLQSFFFFLWRGRCALEATPPTLFCYMSLLDLLIWNSCFLLTTHSTFSVLNFKLEGVQTNYVLIVLHLYSILASAFHTYHMKTVCSCWVWKLSNVACPLNLILRASFLMHSDWLEKKANQLLCIRKAERSHGKMRVMPTKKTMVRCYCIIDNV